MATRVVNVRTEKCDVYVARPSRWGNPYSHQANTLATFRVRSREEAIAAYETWICQQPELLAALPTLKGKILGCFCSPAACHAEVLARLADDPVAPVVRIAEQEIAPCQMTLPGAD